MKRTLCLLLAICALAELCACGTRISAQPQPGSLSTEPRYGYTVQFEALPGEMELLTDEYIYDERLCISGIDARNQPLLYLCSDDEATRIPLPDDISYIYACYMDENGIAIVAGDYPASWTSADNTLRRNDEEAALTYIVRLDTAGEVQGRTALPDVTGGSKSWDSILHDAGYFYIMSSTDLLQISETGEPANRLHLESGNFHAQMMINGELYICFFDSSADGGDDTVKIERMTNKSRLTFDTVYADSELMLIGMGYDLNGCILTNMGEYIASVSPNDAGRAELFNFYEAGMLSTYFTRIYPWNDGYLLVNPDTDRLTKIVYGELTKKEELLLWLPGGGDAEIGEWVEEFNLVNTRYAVAVETVDISEKQSGDAIRTGIISGKAPDLYFTGDGSSFGSFSGSTVFEDLMPYIDSSDVISRDDLLMPVIDAVRESGGLFSMPIDFTVFTMSERLDLLPEKDMSISEMLYLPQVQSGDISVLPTDMSRESLWYWLSSLYVCSNMDEEKGICQLETQEYTDLLIACKSSRKNTSVDILSIFSFQQIPGIRRMIYLQNKHGGDIALFDGLGTAYYMGHSFAISNTSRHKDGAWEFIEYVLTADLKKQEFSWPIAKERLKKVLDTASTKGIWFNDAGDYKTLSEANVKQLWRFFADESAAGAIGKHPDLVKIMEEEAARFFAGDKTSEEAAAITQSRADVYLAERHG